MTQSSSDSDLVVCRTDDHQYFLEQYDLTGKKVIPFATSGSSGIGNTNAELRCSCSGAVLCEGRRWLPQLGLMR